MLVIRKKITKSKMFIIQTYGDLGGWGGNRRTESSGPFSIFYPQELTSHCRFRSAIFQNGLTASSIEYEKKS